MTFFDPPFFCLSLTPFFHPVAAVGLFFFPPRAVVFARGLAAKDCQAKFGVALDSVGASRLIFLCALTFPSEPPDRDVFISLHRALRP